MPRSFPAFPVARLLAGITIACGASAALAWPDKPIRMVAVSAPGGSTDLLARMYAARLATQLGQQVLIDNRAGGGGMIASELVARAPADGYTLLFTHTSHSVLPSMHSRLPYDPFNDFAPIGLVALTHSVLLVSPQVQAKSVKELIEQARARPGQMNYGAGSTGASAHLAGELFKLMAKVNIVHVPYKGTGAQLTALLGNEIQMSFSTVPAAIPHIQAGRLRALGVGSLSRASALPDVPTISEAALPGFDVSAWNGVLGPARMPQAVITRVNRELAEIAKHPETREKAAAQGTDLVSGTPQEFAAYIKSQIAKWSKVVKAAGIQPD
ncbi:MAG: tripartite tricarboxylate transporter substrate binding protein [Burkholderiales bacterium]|nr:tripartite tricarboxylate transporter substrate binding protein [Burkholderiales bacterium]